MPPRSVALAGLLGIAASAAATELPPASPLTAPASRVPRAGGAIRIDGSLDEAVWGEALRLDLGFEVSPGENLPASVATEVLLLYDDDRVYAGFRAHDPDPASIRARLSDRDRAFQDDFVGIVVDTFNDERRAFEVFANPLGVQMDLVVDDVAGNEDESWDAIWDSAGQITADGYVVEIAIPYTSLRFQRGSGDQTWGLDAIRVYPRDRRYQFTLTPRDKNVSCYLCQVSKVVGFSGAEPGSNLEIVPTVTSIRTDVLDAFPDGSLETGETDVEPGVTARWGMTPNLTLSAAINPDFSQVEADAGQLAVNEQFALFFPEKRPFFLEGSDFFDTPVQAVYTRTIVDPAGALKVTGKEGKNALGAFVLRDDRTNLLFPGSQGSDAGALEGPSDVGVFRYRRDIWNNATVGGLLTLRQGEGYRNEVYGVDTLLRPAPTDSIRMQLLGSRTEYPDEIASEFGQPTGELSDHALRFSYFHDTRSWSVNAGYRDIGPEFRADVGFVPQVDIRQPIVGGGWTWWGKPGAVFSRITAGGDWDQTTDQRGELIERETEGYVTLQGPLQSFIFAGGGYRERGFRAERFAQPFAAVEFELVPVAAVRLGLSTGVSKRIDFGFVDPLDPGAARQGDELRLSPWFRLNLGRHVRIDASHDFRRLDLDSGEAFRAGLTQMTFGYQASLRMFFRAILQYTDVHTDLDLYPACDPDPAACGMVPESHDLFTQLLFSYKVNPQTAIYAGYSDAQSGLEEVPLTRTERTFFIKIGYAWVS